MGLLFGSLIFYSYICIVNQLKQIKMNSKVKEILRKQAYDFAIQCGSTEAEAIEAGEQKIRNMERLSERETKTKWVDITTGKKHIPQTPY